MIKFEIYLISQRVAFFIGWKSTIRPAVMDSTVNAGGRTLMSALMSGCDDYLPNHTQIIANSLIFPHFQDSRCSVCT